MVIEENTKKSHVEVTLEPQNVINTQNAINVIYMWLTHTHK